jgi:hypothetical protein
MYRSTHARHRASRLIAAGASAVVALALVFPPQATQPSIPRPVHVSAIQLRASSTELTSATIVTNRTAASTPQANASPEATIRSALILAGAIAVTPVWYVGFPLTLPISFLLANGLKGLFFPQGGIRELVFFGVGIYAVAPVLAIAYAFGPFAAPAASRPAKKSPAVAQTTRDVRDVNRGLAGSKRTANPKPTAERRPLAHRTAARATAKTSTENKPRGTAGSARGANK